MPKLKDIYEQAKDSINTAFDNIEVGSLLVQITKLPGVRINRKDFLEKELKVLYPSDTVQMAIQRSPAYAKIPKTAVDSIAKKIINYETNKVSAISFAAGIPGGLAMLGTIPADVTQFFYFSVRVMQKLAYLYGFQEFDLKENEIDDGTLNEMLVFLGVMFGAQEANVGLKMLAKTAAAQAVRKLERAAIMKIPAYVGLKTAAKYLGVQMNRQVLQKVVGGAIPVLGGVLMGGVSFASFKLSANRLRKQFNNLPIADPSFYDDEQAVEEFINEVDHVGPGIEHIDIIDNPDEEIE